MKDRPNLNSESQKELDKATQQIDMFNDQVEQCTLDRMNLAPKMEHEPQDPKSSNQIARLPDLYLKPHRTVGCAEKFNENYRKEWNFSKEYVKFEAENKEIIGETIDMWTKPFAGIPAEWWKIPCNKPLWAPRYVAEQLKRCYYHRLIMGKQTSAGHDSYGNEFLNTIAVDSTVQRLDARPVSDNKSIFMGNTRFGT
jgi:hypothetical protein